MNNDCGCCEGLDIITPEPIFNRPGLKTLSYRVGNHASFLESMQARLSSLIELSADKERQEKLKKLQEQLKNLKTRDSSDWSIALLDAWATVADVLSFYQERIANEGFLNTAIERRSILELTNLVGYRLKPGVAASVYLAFTLEKDYNNVEIPEGNRSQSIPQPGETAQTFETVEKIQASADWNVLRPKQKQVQLLTKDNGNDDFTTIYIQGYTTNLNQNTPLLIVAGESANQRYYLRFILKISAPTIQNIIKEDYTKIQVKKIKIDNESKFQVYAFRVTAPLFGNNAPSSYYKFKGPPPAVEAELVNVGIAKSDEQSNIITLDRLYEQILSDPSEPQNYVAIQNENIYLDFHKLQNYQLEIRIIDSFDSLTSDTEEIVLIAKVDSSYYARIFNQEKMIVFGREREKSKLSPNEDLMKELEQIINDLTNRRIASISIKENSSELIQKILLDLFSRDLYAFDGNARIFKYISSGKTSVAKYQLTGRVTKIELFDDNDDDKKQNPWYLEDLPDDNNRNNEIFDDLIRESSIYAQSELLKLSEAPILTPVEGNEIILDELYPGLEIGRKIIVSGEVLNKDNQTDGQLKREEEIVTISSVKEEQGSTKLTLNNELKNSYVRDTVTIYGNVAKASHGETRTEVLGSGDARKPLQQFTLGQSPLTYLSKPTPAGIQSSLQIRVNDVLWHEVESLEELEEGDRNYITRTDNEQNTTVTFGNGRNGALLPTGVGNIMAKYRTSIGKSGNVKAEQISQLISRPLGLKEVINPKPATGGADPEDLEDARRNALLPLFAMDRLVSVQDYEDFARAFAGIGKASARYLSDGSRELVYLTIAGAENIPITSESELYTNLIGALRQFGTLPQALEVDIYKPINLKIEASVRILPNYLWDNVQPTIRTALLDEFSFRNRELGQDVTLAEVISSIQQVSGVSYVDIDFLGVGEETSQPLDRPKSRVVANLARVDPDSTSRPLSLNPAELIFLSPDKPDNLILREVNNE